MKLDVEKLPPTLPNKVISVAAVFSSKEGPGAIMKPLFVYRVISKIVNLWTVLIFSYVILYECRMYIKNCK